MSNDGWTRRRFVKNAAGTGIALGGAAALSAMPAAAQAATASPEKIALTNVRVFDGRSLSGRRTVIIDNGVIGLNPLGARTIDGGGATLLPGLIDAHLHLEDLTTLQQLTGYGVTTGLDMACWPAARVNALRHQPGLTDIRSAGLPAVSPGSPQTQSPTFPQSEVVTGPGVADQFVAHRVAEGSDYIKIIADIPGFDVATITALVNAAHKYNRLAMAHATSFAVINEVLQAGADVIHHVPLDTAITAAVAGQYASRGRVSVPTLGMMEGFSRLGVPGWTYAAARDSVTALRRAGVQILAGTDANHTPGIPVQPAYGSSLHHELELLVGAGLTPVDALRSATVLPAQTFRLYDRGTISPGKRADLVLVDGDPTTDIRATRNIRRIWVGGVEHAPATA